MRRLVANGPGIGDAVVLTALAREWIVQVGGPLAVSCAWPEVFAGWPVEVEPWAGVEARSCPELDDQTVTGGEHNIRHMLRRLGLRVPDAAPRCWLPRLPDPGPEVLAGRAYVAEMPPRYATVSPKAGGWTRNKDWPPVLWAQVLADLDLGCPVFQLGAEDDPLIPGAGDLRGIPLATSIEVVRHARVHACVVTGTMHVASGTGTPTVAIFGGREAPGVTGYPAATNLVARPPCAPCWLVPPCPHGMPAPCLTAITPDVVTAAIRAAFERAKGNPWDQSPTGF